MKPLEQFDFKQKCNERYNVGFDGNSVQGYKDTTYSQTARDLINTIENEDRPFNFRSQLFSIIQLYFDGLIEKSTNWNRENEILNSLFSAGKDFTSSFYRAEEINYNSIREKILPYSSEIIDSSSEEGAKFRHLECDFNEIRQLGVQLSNCFEDKYFDVVVSIASGAFEPSVLAMDILDIESIIAIRSSKVSKKDPTPKMPLGAPEDYLNQNIKNKKVLIVEDVIDSGRTIDKIINSVYKCDPKEVYGIAVQTYNWWKPRPVKFIFQTNKYTQIFKINGKENVLSQFMRNLNRKMAISMVG